MRDVVAGLLLLAIALIAAWQASDLTLGSLRHMGPGFLPLALAAMIGALGIALVAGGLRARHASGLHWPLRGPIMILGAAVVFSLTVRPLGLVAAGPLVVIISGLAGSDTRWKELLIFGLAMTGFCLLLFRFALSLPIPVAPWLIGY